MSLRQSLYVDDDQLEICCSNLGGALDCMRVGRMDDLEGKSKV
jgi:hypothetical protein